MVEEVARTPGVRRIRRRGRFGWKGLPFARLGGGPGPRPDCLDYGPLPAAALLDDNDSMAGASLETLISAERLQARVEQLGRRISADYPAHPDAPDLRLIGVLKGAFVFLSDLIRHIERDVSVDFLGVSTYGVVHGKFGRSENPKGSRPRNRRPRRRVGRGYHRHRHHAQLSVRRSQAT